MDRALRFGGWAWLAAGLAGVAALYLSRFGIHTPLSHEAAMLLAMPWSRLVPLLDVGPTLGAAILLIGVIINANILFVLAGLARR